MKTHFTGLWHNPDFMRLWVSQTISEFGSRVTRDALPLIAVITLTATPVQLGLLTAIPSIPILLFGLYIGVWIDRLPRLRILFLTNIIRPLILLAIPLTALWGILSVELLYIISAVLSVLGMTFEIAYRAVLPSLVKSEALFEGNSKLAMTDSLAEIGGPALAGLLIQWFTAPFAVLFDIVSYLIAAFILKDIRKQETPRTKPDDIEANSIHEILTGWRFLAGHKLLRPLVLYRSFTSFFGSFIGPLYALFAIETLNLSPAQLGMVIASGGIGAILGSFLSGRLASSRNFGKRLISILLLNGLMVLLIPLTSGSVTQVMILLIISQIVGDATAVLFSIHELSLRQSLTSEELLGRINASSEFLIQGVAPLGAILAGFLATASNPRFVLFLAAFGVIASSLWIILSPLRTVKGFHVHLTE